VINYNQVIQSERLVKMKFSTKSKYGLKAMIDLSYVSKDELVSIKVIAERQSIPDSYLEQLFSTLRKSGLIKSVKGPYGGYKLASPADEITVAAIVRALDGELTVLTDKDNVTFKEDSLGYFINKEVWEKVDEQVQHLLNDLSLEDMKQGYDKLTNKESYMYYI